MLLALFSHAICLVNYIAKLISTPLKNYMFFNSVNARRFLIYRYISRNMLREKTQQTILCDILFSCSMFSELHHEVDIDTIERLYMKIKLNYLMFINFTLKILEKM